MGILIVDDDFAIRDSLSQLLEGEGFQVSSVADGQEALNYLLQSPERPCLILLDLMMPGVDGWHFRHRQKQYPAFASIPVAIISAHPNFRSQATTLDAQGYIDKPIDIDALFEIVARYCV
ncbi:MAG: response regulator [Chloroflexia bacterium]